MHAEVASGMGGVDTLPISDVTHIGSLTRMVEVVGAAEAESLLQEADALAARLAKVREGVGRVIFGQEQVVERTLITLLSGGHLLLVGVPGLGKTKLVETLGTVLGLDARRVQFTPDLMPTSWAARCWRRMPRAAAPSASSRGRSSASC
jgi:hypothetical protein